jgi:hypothetical protein
MRKGMWQCVCGTARSVNPSVGRSNWACLGSELAGNTLFHYEIILRLTNLSEPQSRFLKPRGGGS